MVFLALASVAYLHNLVRPPLSKTASGKIMITTRLVSGVIGTINFLVIV
jgi:hypothetical protein